MSTTNHATSAHPSRATADRPAQPAVHGTRRDPGRRLRLAVLLVAFIAAACNAPILRDPSLAKPVIPNAEIDSAPQDSFDDAIFVERVITFIDDY
jgi:hypothetical protein